MGYVIQTDPRRRHEAGHKEAASPASPIARPAANLAEQLIRSHDYWPRARRIWLAMGERQLVRSEASWLL
ncbi:hypothetical protein X728_26430 [Mesorhizobium sp. L103C120A0]|nr:hypothetical protein X728_26430 [Mesorhizobium sp. L103C120A0]